MDAFNTMAEAFPDKHFAIAKGRITPAEPLYGATVYDEASAGETILAEGEGDTIEEAVNNCIAAFKRTII